MKRYFAILLLLATIQFPSYAQSLLIGGRLAPNFLIGKSSGFSNRSASGIGLQPALSLGYRFNDVFTIETQAGLLLSDNFSGIEYGFLLKGNILEDRLYLLGGLNIHNNIGDAHGTLISADIYRKTYFLPGIGFGINLSKSMFIELQYYKTLDEKIGEDHYATYTGPASWTVYKSYYTMEHIFRLSLGFDVSFPLTKAQAEKEADHEPSAVSGKKGTPSPALPDRNMFFRIGTGFPDIASAQLGCQLFKYFSVAGKTNWSLIDAGPDKRLMLGLKLTGYLPNSSFNNISVEYNEFTRNLSENFLNNGSRAQVAMTIGHEDVSGKFINFYWSVGVILMQKNGNIADLILPTLKLGLNIDLL
ncbi:MAG: hypothetical protein ACM3S2_03430 [Ignavibacteriales bacterium]